MNEPKSLSELMEQKKQENPIEIDTIAGVDVSTDTEEAVAEENKDIIVGGEDQVQLPLEALQLDATTPGSSMSNLQKFTTEGMDEKVEEAKQERERLEIEDAAAQEREAIDAKTEEMKEQFQDEVVEEKETVVEDNTPKMDLSSIKVMKPKDLDTTFTNFLVQEREEAPKTKVLLPVSGYSATMIGMASPEIRNLSSTLNNLDSYGYLDTKYQNAYKRMITSSVGKMDYETFLKRTALMEYEILAYGLFSSSYPDENKYPFECSKCHGKDTFVYNNKQYMMLPEKNPELRKEIEDALLGVIKAEATNAVDFFENADTNTLVRKYLKDSKIIIELRHPTLFDQLNDVVRNVSETLIEEAEEIVNLMPFIFRVYYPTPDTFHDEVPTYIELDDVNKKITALMKLSDADDEQLAKDINDEILSKYKVKYALKAPKCRLCGHQTPPQAVSFDQMLFMMRQIRITKR